MRLERAVLRKPLESKLRPRSQNIKNVNENKISFLEIAKIVSIDLNVHPGEAPNSTKKEKKKKMVGNNF